MPWEKSAEKKANAENESALERMDRMVRQVPADRQSSIREMIEWTMRNAVTPIEDLDLESCPDRGALGMLEWARRPANYGTFLTSIWAKLIPPKMQGEAEPRYNDDGHKILELLDRFQESFNGKEE